jgi:hypothetical protein
MPSNVNRSLNVLRTAARKLSAWAVSRPRTVAAAVLMTAMLLAGGGAQAASAYVNPFAGDHVRMGRIDMGVDLCLRSGEPIRAIGYGVVVGHLNNWYAGQPYLWYRLFYGAHAGSYVYIAEQINHLAPVGTHFAPGAVLARFAPTGSCIETGWATRSGWTLAQATTGYREGQVTSAGRSFSQFLYSLGAR